MRVMALDIGKVRCGIAMSDPKARVASPLCVLPTKDVQSNAPSFKRIWQDWEPDLLVVGLPLSLSGETGAQAHTNKKIAQHIAATLKVPLEFCDERLSSKEAKRILREEGLSEKAMRGKVDMVAASLFLQTWLDSRDYSRE